MNPGAILIGVAAAILLGIYIAQPFRRRVDDLDALIEAWTAQEAKRTAAGARTAPSRLGKKPAAVSPAKEDATEEAPVEAVSSVPKEESTQEETINFCHQCGRRVKSHHRFCPGCGARLIEE
ncbi:MAG: zinc-ribbon domain-containing protein [Anaerolineae bacterium]